MEISLEKFRDEYQQLLLQFLWGQWSAIGVSGHARNENPFIIDPEALLLFSTEIARQDPRLFDEILDWLHDHATWISLQRLSRMGKEYTFGSDTVLSAIAEHLSLESPNQKWKAVRNNQLKTNDDTIQPLFQNSEHFGETDSIFLKWGWQRNPVRYRGLSVAPHIDQPAAFLFKLRSLFGRQSRAEIIAWLLANESGHPAEIARQTGYFRRSVQIVLNELEASKHIRVQRVGRKKHFSILHEQWRFLAEWTNSETLPFGFPRWIVWPAVFELLAQVNRVLCKPGLESMSPSLKAIELRDAISRSNIPITGFPIQFKPPVHLKGNAFLQATLQQLKQFL